MQRTAKRRWLWWSRFCPGFTSWLHTLDPPKESAQTDRPSARCQDLVAGSTRESPQGTEELRQKNCWKLWKRNWLTAEQISHVLRLPQEATIKFILNFEKTIDKVDWNRLCKLVGLTTSTTQAIFEATMNAKTEFSSSSSVNDRFDSDLMRFYSENVSFFQINLVFIMLEQGLKPSEILHIASLLAYEELPTNYAEGESRADNTLIASAGSRKKDPSDASWECCSGKESEGIKNTDLLSRHDQLLSSVWHEHGQENEDFKNSTYHCKGVEGQDTQRLADSLGPLEMVLGQKAARLFNLIEWLQKNKMVVDAFGYCEAKHLLLLLLESLEHAIINENAGVLRTAYQETMCRLEKPGTPSLQDSLAFTRMHRALSLKAVLLGVHIHVPKRSVEFVIRSGRQSFHKSSVYHVFIIKHPSCTCPDFVCRVRAGYEYVPCKHLFYIYLVQLSIEKDLEHIMFQSVLTEEDLERILVGYYREIT